MYLDLNFTRKDNKIVNLKDGVSMVCRERLKIVITKITDYKTERRIGGKTIVNGECCATKEDDSITFNFTYIGKLGEDRQMIYDRLEHLAHDRFQERLLISKKDTLKDLIDEVIETQVRKGL